TRQQSRCRVYRASEARLEAIMQTVNTRGEAKKLASALRKALKTLEPGSQLSHSHACEAVAMAFGFKNWSAFSATLAEDAPASETSAPTAPVMAPAKKYPLSNLKGRFDFTDKGILVHGVSFEEPQGTVEDIFF